MNNDVSDVITRSTQLEDVGYKVPGTDVASKRDRFTSHIPSSLARLDLDGAWWGQWRLHLFQLLADVSTSTSSTTAAC